MLQSHLEPGRTHFCIITVTAIVAITIVHEVTRRREFITTPTIRRIRRCENRLIDSDTLLLAVSRGLICIGVGERQPRAGGEASLVSHRLDRESAVGGLWHRVGRGIGGR